MFGSLKLGLGLTPQPSKPSAAPFVPSMAGAIVGGWYDGSDASTITHTSNVVSQWNDKSGSNRHVSQAGASTLRPTWNGSNGLSFDGGDYLFNTTPWMKANNKIAIYAVVQLASGNGLVMIGEGNNASSNQLYSVGTKAAASSTDSAFFMRNDAAGVVVNSAQTSPN